MESTKNFDSAIMSVCNRLRSTLEFLPAAIKQNVQEIRLRNGLPIALTVKGKPLYITKGGNLSEIISRDLLKAEKSDIEESFMLLCKRSVYAHTAELKEGYIVMDKGHRAGVCGTISTDGQLRDISSINIRIAHEIIGCAERIIDHFDGGGFIIAGPPGSGKTTMLRDFIRLLSSGKTGEYKKLSVIDSRGEISGSSFGNCFNDLGENTDILIIKDKVMGMEIALRTLFPDIIAFDEIGNSTELRLLLESFNAGVCTVTTLHAGSLEELLRRPISKSLLASGAISKIALLPSNIGGEIKVYKAGEIRDYANA